MSPLVEIRALHKSFVWRHPLYVRQTRRLRAVDGVDLDVARGECLALVGESGSGKTTLVRCMLRLIEPDSGEVCFEGENLRTLSRRQLRRRRQQFQMVFQNSAAALDPRMRVEAILAEPLRLHRIAGRAEIPGRVRDLLRTVDLPESLVARYPHQLSGGQRQRVGIARALATEPKLLVLDEPVSALDVSVRARILRLLADLKQRFRLTVVIIAHDLAMVEQVADRVAVCYLGRVVEIGPRQQVFSRPRHPYTASLLAAVPVPVPGRPKAPVPVSGEVPSPWAPPPGCAFHPRCPLVGRLAGHEQERCRSQVPALVSHADGAAACHFPGQIEGRGRDRKPATPKRPE